ncbi:MAG: class II fructose-bisphosphate aldolase [Dehalococcoidia bacterium]|nr:class II fructose-bisphosphate aldolase [Dehalococcoidia bacterium]MCB9485967.1 class II fructose-bisphosphate aldolase [Thermoflexaceae bacterium]
MDSAAIEAISQLARAATRDGAEAATARATIFDMASAAGIFSASILPLYEARGRRETGGFTVPAVNVRGLTFEVARSMFDAMGATDCAAAIFEINRAEVGFTGQHPAEFASQVLAAALASGWRGPVFLQLDHLMASPAAYAADRAAEMAALETLIVDALAAGFGNIDIDASTLVDLAFPAVADQQRPNVDLTAHLARVVRANQQKGVSVSIGGEIGEVGSHNSTDEELITFVEGFLEATRGEPVGGLSKVSVQTGTRHGGVILPDGSTADVALDFETLGRLSAICTDRYGMAGTVQHGASTLPDSMFSRFPEVACAEVHLATGFQDAVIDHPAFPAGLRDEMHAWTLSALASERQPGETDAQFIRRGRRKAWGPFKQRCLEIPGSERALIRTALTGRFVRLFGQLGVDGSRRLVERYVHQPS